MACAAEATMIGLPIMVGHSMGGMVTIAAANLFGEKLAGAVVIDSPVRRPDPGSDEGERGKMFRNPKTYGSEDEVVRHFHLQYSDLAARRALGEPAVGGS
jgi:pimeloyl-ACP methyl ester carboxylesterase